MDPDPGGHGGGVLGDRVWFFVTGDWRDAPALRCAQGVVHRVRELRRLLLPHLHDQPAVAPLRLRGAARDHDRRHDPGAGADGGHHLVQRETGPRHGNCDDGHRHRRTRHSAADHGVHQGAGLAELVAGECARLPRPRAARVAAVPQGPALRCRSAARRGRPERDGRPRAARRDRRLHPTGGAIEGILAVVWHLRPSHVRAVGGVGQHPGIRRGHGLRHHDRCLVHLVGRRGQRALSLSVRVVGRPLQHPVRVGDGRCLSGGGVARPQSLRHHPRVARPSTHRALCPGPGDGDRGLCHGLAGARRQVLRTVLRSAPCSARRSPR